MLYSPREDCVSYPEDLPAELTDCLPVSCAAPEKLEHGMKRRANKTDKLLA